MIFLAGRGDGLDKPEEHEDCPPPTEAGCCALVGTCGVEVRADKTVLEGEQGGLMDDSSVRDGALGSVWLLVFSDSEDCTEGGHSRDNLKEKYTLSKNNDIEP